MKKLELLLENNKHQRLINGFISIFLFILYYYYSEKFIYSSSRRDFIKLDIVLYSTIIFILQTVFNSYLLNRIIIFSFIALAVYYTYSVFYRIFNLDNLHCFNYSISMKLGVFASLIILYVIVMTLILFINKMNPK
jgi:hypothetical protein